VPADLSDTGAVARLAAALPEDALVVSSDLDRAVRTADAIAGSRRRLAHDPGLREFHFGAWDGVHFSEVAERDEALSRAYWETPGDHAPPGGESWNAAAARVAAAVRRIEAHGARDVIVVAHFGVILTQLQAALGITAAEVLAYKIDPLSLTVLHPDEGRAARINDCP
ncbi:MAG: histidine phosphatase family protein, partial [Pseudomonadota bacterium]